MICDGLADFKTENNLNFIVARPRDGPIYAATWLCFLGPFTRTFIPS